MALDSVFHLPFFVSESSTITFLRDHYSPPHPTPKCHWHCEEQFCLIGTCCLFLLSLDYLFSPLCFGLGTGDKCLPYLTPSGPVFIVRCLCIGFSKWCWGNTDSLSRYCKVMGGGGPSVPQRHFKTLRKPEGVLKEYHHLAPSLCVRRKKKKCWWLLFFIRQLKECVVLTSWAECFIAPTDLEKRRRNKWEELFVLSVSSALTQHGFSETRSFLSRRLSWKITF